MRPTLILCSALLAPAAFGQVSYVSQTRSITALAGGDSHTLSAPGFNVFNEEVSASAEAPFGSASAGARQNSTLGPSVITAQGLASAGGSTRLSGSASSNVDVTFDLLSASDVVLSGTLTVSIFTSNAAYVQLERVGGPVLIRYDETSGDPWFVDFTGANAFHASLGAGRYRLLAHVGAFGAGSSDTKRFDITLSGIPTPGSATLIAFAGLAAARRRRR